jgi:multimeric flavodoxin WrbA
MSYVLGLVGSARPWGNSELLIRQVLRGAAEEGAEVRLVRLTGLHLEPCTGCMACVIGGRPCPLDDDMDWLIDTIGEAGGLALAAPTYFLGPAATIKMVVDRLLMVTGRVDQPLSAPRPAVTIATAGLEGWRGVTLPFLNAFCAAFGFQPIESLTAVAPGPGEVLLDDELMGDVFDAGRRLGRGEMDSAPAPADTCPVCHSDAFVLRGERAVCPICAREATIVRGGDGGLHLRFDPAAVSQHRWTPEALREHMIGWVMATGPRFLAHRSEIRERRKPFRADGIDWLCPPSSQDQ